MKRTGFFTRTLKTENKERKCIPIEEIDGIPCVNFYTKERIIHIPYECLVCFVAENITIPNTTCEDKMWADKLLIDIEEHKNKMQN